MKTFDIVARGRRLAVSQWGEVQSGMPTWVLMHGGLDCTSTWKDVPERLNALTRLPVVSYDRYGYGRSQKLAEKRRIAYRLEESGPVFAEVLGHCGIDQTLILGHSDGGAMGILAAAAHPETVCGVFACAPTVAVEPAMIEAMSQARTAFESGGLRERLRRHHGDNTEPMFWGWHDAWVGPEAASWDMSAQIAATQCPVHAVFGLDDEYGWRPSAQAIIGHANARVEVCALPGVGHHPQHQAWMAVEEGVQRLLHTVLAHGAGTGCTDAAQTADPSPC